MPTILELFKGSSKDISPNIPNQTPVQQRFKGSPQEKAVKSDQDTVIEQELTGIRVRSAVELNNPLIYGNQAIRIATRSTSDVEKMKQATGGAAGDGGLIGRGLGAITGGKFGKFVFGGKVTSLNQARDGINTRLGIPQNLIPTAVKNTGQLQIGLEPDTMITLGKIRNENRSTELGKFLKQTGGGNPKTIGRQILGQGISLGKDKLRTALFGNPNALGANNAAAIDSYSGADSGGKRPANGGWEYSSKLPYSYQISNAKFNTKKVSGIAESASTDITKKITQQREEAKKKLGEAATNATALLKKKLSGKESKPEIDKALESKTKVTSATAKTYTEKNKQFTTNSSVFTDLKLPELEKKAQLEREAKEAEEKKKKLGLPDGISKPKLTGTSSKPEIDKLTESKTKETSDTPKTYTQKIGDYKNEDVTKRIDLSLVSPIKGIDRRKTAGRFGLTEYALFDPKNTTGGFSPNDPTRKYTGVAGDVKTPTLETKYGLSNKGDTINQSKTGKDTDTLSDFIPLQIGSINDGGNVVNFRALITGFTETLSPSWDPSKFVGNPYSFWTYNGVERSASFSLKMYCMSAKELSIMWEKISWLSTKVYPTIVNKIVEAPFIEMTIGSIYKKRVGFINSLSYTIADDITWETNIKDFYLPKVVDVQIEFKLVESAGVEGKSLYNYKMSSDAVKGINNKRAAPQGNVVGTDPITKPAPATGLDFKKVGGVDELKPPPPPKIDSTGVDQVTPPPTTTQTSTPKVADTGKPAETPKQAETPSSTPAVVKTVESSYDTDRQKIEKKYKGRGYPDWLVDNFASKEAEGTKVRNIVKIKEDAYYADIEYADEGGYVREMMFYLKPNGNSTTCKYSKWVADNNGFDPLMKYFKKDEFESSNIKPTIIDGSRNRTPADLGL